MTRQDDLSATHIAWLVDSRSENQKLTLKLFLVIKDRKKELARKELYDVAQGLAAVCFSLWRAVFLADLSNKYDDFANDVSAFLGNLILHNTVAYSHDRQTREWTFVYYVNNARYRLASISETHPHILPSFSVDGLTDKDDPRDFWNKLQTAASTAVRNLERELLKSGAKK